MSKQLEHPAPKQITFNNNPFSLAFDQMSRAFKINQNPAITIIIGSIILYIANQIISNIPSLLNSIGENTSSDGAKIGLGLISIVIGLISIVLSLLISTVWAGFTAYVGLKNARSESVDTMPSVKYAFSKFGTVFIINLVVSLLVLACFVPSLVVGAIGAILLGANIDIGAVLAFILGGILAIAGIVVAIRIGFARSLSVYAAFDEDSGALDAMKRSVSLTKSRLMEVWGMSFPGAIVPIVGPLLTVCGLGAHYLQLKVYKDNSAELPKVSAISWIPLFLLIGIALIAGFIGLIIAIATSANS